MKEKKDVSTKPIHANRRNPENEIPNCLTHRNPTKANEPEESSSRRSQRRNQKADPN